MINFHSLINGTVGMINTSNETNNYAGLPSVKIKKMNQPYRVKPKLLFFVYSHQTKQFNCEMSLKHQILNINC